MEISRLSSPPFSFEDVFKDLQVDFWEGNPACGIVAVSYECNQAAKRSVFAQDGSLKWTDRQSD